MNYRIVNRRKRAVTRAADAMGYALTAPWRFARMRAATAPGHVRSILVIRTAYLGDVMMAVPLLKPLRSLHPDARLSFLTSASAAPLLEHNPYVDEVLTYDPFWFHASSPKARYLDYLRMMRRRRFDLVIETRADVRELLLLVAPLKAKRKVSYAAGGGGWLLTDAVPYKGPLHRVDYHLDIARYLGAPTEDLEWGVYLTEAEQRATDALLDREGVRRPFVVVHPGSRVPLKCWPPERFAAVADRLATKTGQAVVLIGAGGERPIVDRVRAAMRAPSVSLAGRLNLRELAGVLGRSALLVCNDSAPMHVAAAMKTPIVAIFGPSKSIETGPYGTACRVIERPMPCRTACDESRCANRDRWACMNPIEPDEVFTAAMALLSKSGV